MRRNIPGTLLGLAIVPVDAFWRMECAGQATFARVDPLMSPGGPSHHVHALHGSSGTYSVNKSSICQY